MALWIRPSEWNFGLNGEPEDFPDPCIRRYHSIRSVEALVTHLLKEEMVAKAFLEGRLDEMVIVLTYVLTIALYSLFDQIITVVHPELPESLPEEFHASVCRSRCLHAHNI